jgi:DUF971 family protein
MQSLVKAHRPLGVTIDRPSQSMQVRWADGHESTYRLAWLRQICPCATCMDERRSAEDDPLRLHSGPLPSAVVEGVEGMGNYALRFTWADGHGNGIYTFASLRASCPCPACNGGELAELVEI